jgi:hypothetical protein
MRMLRATLIVMLPILVVVPLVVGQEAIPPGVELRVSDWQKSVVEGYWDGDATIILPVDTNMEPEVVHFLLQRVVQEAVAKLPFAVEDWDLTVTFFKGEERQGWTHIQGHNAWQNPLEKAGTELGRGMLGGCESRFQVKHQTYSESGAPVEVTYNCCRWGSTPKAKALLGELPPSQPQSSGELGLWIWLPIAVVLIILLGLAAASSAY